MPQMCCDQSTHHFIIISSWSYHHSSQLVSCLDPRLKRFSTNVQKVWFNSKEIFERILRNVSCLYSLCCAVFSYLLKWFSICWKQNWNSFDVSSGRFAGWRVLFIIFRHMTTQYHSSNERDCDVRDPKTQDVNNSDSGPWNIWCRNLIYFKSPTVLWQSSTKQWNFKLHSELKVTVTEAHFVFSDQLCVWPGASDQWPSHAMSPVVTGCHHSGLLSSSPLPTGDRHAPISGYPVISSNRQILRPHERSAHVNHRISNPLKMPIKL